MKEFLSVCLSTYLSDYRILTFLGPNREKLCDGDYGGSLFWSDPFDYYRATLVGIGVSPYSSYSCEKQKFSIFSYVPRRINWIKSVIGKELVACRPPPSCNCGDVPSKNSLIFPANFFSNHLVISKI